MRQSSLLDRVALGLLLLLALSLRVYRLDSQSLWYDEAVTADVSAKGLPELTRWTADDIQPPLYYYAVAGWTRLAGRGEWALRFPSAFAGILAVPLTWATSRRLFAGRGGAAAALIAALLVAISPLHVYYGQEARMYALLTVFGLATGYALLRSWKQRRWWAGVVAFASATLYTHYFGGFLLAAYAVCLPAATAARRRPYPGYWPLAIASAAAVVLAYLPWLPAMLTRYGVDRSYWSGPLKVDEALRHVAISLTSGAPETMLEGEAVRLLPWFGAVLALALIGLWARGRDSDEGDRRGATLTLLAALVLPVLAVLALASRSPKFNARYLMMVSPAYLLLLSGGLGRLLSLPRRKILTPTLSRWETGARQGGRVLGIAALLFLVAVSSQGLQRWYTDPAFTKAQWRELSAYVRGQIGSDEAVLMVSGHAAPAWRYYAPEVPVIRAPEIEILDVDAVLGFELGGLLGRELAGKDGVWLVGWQDDLVDPVGFAPYYLNRVGEEQLLNQRFWHLTLRHWRVPPDAMYPPTPQPQHLQSANFAHKIALTGWDDPRSDVITVYWRAMNLLPADYQVSLVLEDESGAEIGRWDGRPAGYSYPTTRWSPGQELFGRYPLPLPAEARYGEYVVTLAVYSAEEPDGLDLRDEADNPAGKRVRLAPVHIDR